MPDSRGLIRALKHIVYPPSPEDIRKYEMAFESSLKRFIQDYIQEEAKRGSGWLREVIGKTLSPGQIQR